MSTPPSPTPPSPSALSSTSQVFLEGVQKRVDAAGVFGPTELRAGLLVCNAKGCAEPAQYRLVVDQGGLWVALTTPDRWLSESIEADLMHTGDKIEELIEEELVDQDYERGSLTCQHFRSDDLLFTFRSPLPIAVSAAGDIIASPEDILDAARCLLAYEACFRRLGDMEETKE
jgi:hypothetical protein